MARTLSPRGTARTLLSATLAAATTLGAAAPASAGDVTIYRERTVISDDYQERGFGGHQPHFVEGSRRLYRDEIGRFYLRHGRKHYVQLWQREARPHWQDPEWQEPNWQEPRRHETHRPETRRNGSVAETAIIAGIAGLAVGAIIAGSQPQQRVVSQPAPLPRNTFPARPQDTGFGGPQVVTLDESFEPWSAGWADWCRNRYRSFNPSTGTYTGYDGVRRFCEVK